MVTRSSISAAAGYESMKLFLTARLRPHRMATFGAATQSRARTTICTAMLTSTSTASAAASSLLHNRCDASGRRAGRLWGNRGLLIRGLGCRGRKQMKIAFVFGWRVGSRGHVDYCQHADDDANGRHGAYGTSSLFPIGHDHLVPRRSYALAVSGCRG